MIVLVNSAALVDHLLHHGHGDVYSENSLVQAMSEYRAYSPCRAMVQKLSLMGRPSNYQNLSLRSISSETSRL